ncbi:MAG: flippase [Chitinispirillaceae bacterium]|nr:flippase [Chitinispirillaceae bacterium]
MKIVSRVLALRQRAGARKIFDNIVYLSMQQAANYLLPLITVPYLLYHLGTERYGLLAFAAAFIAYFQVIVDYGFNYSAVQAVSIHRADPNRLSRILSAVTAVKTVFASACLCVLLLLIAFVPLFHRDAALYLWTFAATVGTIFFPAWFFQGVEEMKYITVFNFILRGGVVALMFVFIKNPDDFMWVPYLNAGGTALVGILSMAIVSVKFRVVPLLPDRDTISEVLRNGFRIFVSQIVLTLFTNTNTFVLGIFTNNFVVGTYAIADKIARAGIALSVPVSNAIYPRTVLLFKESRERARLFLRKVLVGGSALFGAVSTALFLLAEPVVSIITGTHNDLAVLLVRILALLPLSVFIDNIYGVQVLLNIGGMQKHFLRATIAAGVLSVCMQFTLVPRFHAVGTAVSFLAAELCILIMYIIPVRRAGFKLP